MRTLLVLMMRIRLLETRNQIISQEKKEKTGFLVVLVLTPLMAVMATIISMVEQVLTHSPAVQAQIPLSCELVMVGLH